jgi:phosphoserine phosphatase RsbU/P
MPDEGTEKKYTSPFELQPLVEFTRTINSSFDLDFILNNVLYTLMGKLLYTRGLIVLRDSDGRYRVVKAKGAKDADTVTRIDFTPPPPPLVSFDAMPANEYPWTAELQRAGIEYLYGLTVRDELIGFIAMGKRVGDRPFSESEEIFLRSLVNISATAIEKARILLELKDANRNLDSRVQELKTLFEMGKEFGSTLRRDQLVKILVFSLLGHVGTNRYLIAVKDRDACEIIASRLPIKEIRKEYLDDFVRITIPVLTEKSETVFEADTVACLRDNNIAVVVPMTLQGETRGVILLGSRMGARPYTERELEFLSSLGNLAMISLENIRLVEETIEKQRLEDELKLAQEIQQGLLPKRIPVTEGFQIAARTIASKQVGGDYFDIVELDEHRFLLVIADVSGKGTPASLLMANLQATIRAIAPLDITIAEATARVNNLIFDNTSADKFITFFWAILDIKEKIFKYVNAGHNPPFLIRSDGSIERLEKGGMILGVLRSVNLYEHDIVPLRPGDCVMLFTDGVSEAMNQAREEFGEERLGSILMDARGQSAEAILDTTIRAVTEYAGSASQSDDITALVVKAL